ncbi:tRNA (adenine(58)-N(1))-methyltransferase catalytic subunit TRMT61A isoform X1 [Hydra vulgaris]|uniref:tRNA (adenine(58)-N(1))-methyltransferase catalytic subunit TRMT61A isoform X1 n=1 Tax=Hydra vulgaris TaxID=6087 RepID=UPI0006416D3D|nr:tRNA (adenine(58)-N(1))-methyltransferase catalytic subunit TRMT61A [Hydra vulgaris]
MSFNKWKKTVDEGDTIMISLGKQSIMTILVESSKTLQTKFGAFPHKEFIGQKFGTKIFSKNRKGWVFLLHPSPELWTVSLPHRTQILYSTDISLIVMELELKPGSIVVESGTGSGSLSHAILRSIKPSGHLYTFDFHLQRVDKAREEFMQHGLENFVTCKCADACADGFSLEDKADAVFLDLPSPWDAIPHAIKTIKKSGGRLCSFSPCIEQVQRTCDVLRQFRFCEIKTVECLVRTLNVKTIPVPEANIGSLDFSNIDDEKPTDSKRMKQNEEEIQSQLPHIPQFASTKEPYIENNQIASTDESRIKDAKCANVTGVNSLGMVTKLTAKSKSRHCNVLTCKGNKEMPGHTGFLTFASLYPS